MPDKKYNAGRAEITARLLETIMELSCAANPTRLSRLAGFSQGAVSQWEHGQSFPTRRNIKRLILATFIAAVEPIYEFTPLKPKKKNGVWQLHDNTTTQEMRSRLSNKKGIYLFYDSSGRVCYVGKAQKGSNDLYFEIVQRFRGAAYNRNFFAPKAKSGIKQWRIARYLSAYEVRVPAFIHNLEVLMLRCFANDSANTRSGEFQHRLPKHHA